MLSQIEVAASGASQNGKFASPTEEIFIQDAHVGTVYKWDDGLETTVWFGGSKPEGHCVSKSNEDQRLGWRDLFSNKT